MIAPASSQTLFFYPIGLISRLSQPTPLPQGVFPVQMYTCILAILCQSRDVCDPRCVAGPNELSGGSTSTHHQVGTSQPAWLTWRGKP